MLQGFILGGMLLAAFLAGALVVARIPPLLGPVNDLLDHARFGSLWVVAAICLGLLTAAQRRVTGGVLGPITSHLTWSLGMLFLLPHVLTLGV